MNPSQPASVQLDPSALLKATQFATNATINALIQQMAYSEMQILDLQKEVTDLKQKLSGNAPDKN